MAEPAGRSVAAVAHGIRKPAPRIEMSQCGEKKLFAKFFMIIKRIGTWTRVSKKKEEGRRLRATKSRKWKGI